MAQPNQWESVIEELQEATAVLLRCDCWDPGEIQRLIERRATAVGELMALETPCPSHLVFALEQIHKDGDRIGHRLEAFKWKMQSELTGLLQIRSMLDAGDPLPGRIDISA